MTRVRNSLLLAIFLLATALPCALFLTRIGVYAANPKSKSFLLRGGATEIGGIPKEPAASSFKSLIEWHLTQNNPPKILSLECTAQCKRLLAWNIPTIQSSTANNYKLSNSMLAKAFYRPPKAAGRAASRLAKTISLLSSVQTNILYVISPNRVTKANHLAYNIFDNMDAWANLLKGSLEQANVQVLDLRIDPVFSDKRPEDIFFPTDHHMRGQAGLWVAQAEAEALRDRYCLPIDPSVLSGENYTCQIFPHSFLGSLGRSLSRIPCPPDDFDLIAYSHPLDLDFLLIAKDQKNTRKSGDVSILFNTHTFQLSLYQGNRYATYLGPDVPFLEIVNHSCSNGVSLLLIGDSFDNCVIPPLIPAVSRIVSIDPRHCGSFFTGKSSPNLPPELTLPFSQYIATQPFDAILVMMNGTNLEKPLDELLSKASGASATP